MEQSYQELIRRLREVETLRAASRLLSWDQETYMPPRAQARRAEQLALLSELAHRRFTDQAVGALLAELPEDAVRERLGAEAAANVRETAREYARATRLPPDFVAELARTTSLAHQAWVEARGRADFERFAPHLERVVALKRQEAELLGYEEEIYDALLEEYEPGARAAQIAPMLAGLREVLVPIVQKATAAAGGGWQPAAAFAVQAQQQLCRRLAELMGFDFTAGRLDVSAHPFCTGIDTGDVRLTTRYHEHDVADALFGVMHEVGHGLYEQGLDPEHFGTPMGSACSTGIHESQSRLWENQIGRSRAFWKYFLPVLRETFPEATAGLELEEWYRRINRVRPSLIRVEADEVTYNLHILLRFEIERELLAARIGVSELPALWNRKMEEYLGLAPPDDAQGVLQDVHWSFGGIGYFPTYTLGNLYAAQIFAAMRRELGNLEAQLERGELSEIRAWLREKIHRRGMLLRAHELLAEVTGEPPSARAFTEYIQSKFGELYG
ncbi:MAG: carboxypeptidase M32 [Planctomycetota bacterium]|nr:MAG: carboxypeptidase M32 [Planctomycetota bacterium]